MDLFDQDELRGKERFDNRTINHWQTNVCNIIKHTKAPGQFRGF